METKLAKLSASIEADQALDRMIQRVNDGFNGGKVTKVNLVSWIISYFEVHNFEGCIERLRKDNFDQVAYIESMLREMKKARKSGGIIPDVGTMLAPLVSTTKPLVGRGRPKNDKRDAEPETGRTKAA